MYQDPVRVCLYRIEVKGLMRPRMSEHVLLEKMCGRMCEPSGSIVHGGLKECCCSCVCVWLPASNRREVAGAYSQRSVQRRTSDSVPSRASKEKRWSGGTVDVRE